MNFKRRKFLHYLAAGAAALPALSHIARAQAYPTRPVRIVVGFPAGGTADILARLIGQWLSDRLGQPFIIENRPGASTNIGTEVVVNAPPDGYSVLLTSTAGAINSTLYDKLNYNFLRDIAPVGGLISVPLVMEVHPSFQAKTIPEFIANAKKDKEAQRWASAPLSIFYKRRSGRGLFAFLRAFALRFAFDVLLADIAAAKQIAGRVLLHDLVLQPHEAIKQRLGPRRASRNIDINRDYPIHALQGRICRKRAAR